MDDTDLQEEEISRLRWKAADDLDHDALSRLSELASQQDNLGLAMYEGRLMLSESVVAEVSPPGDCWTAYPLSHYPVEVNSLVGAIYLGDTPVQNFIPKVERDVYALSEYYDNTTPEIKAEELHVDRRSGTLRIRWNKPPGVTKVHVSYVYIEDPRDYQLYYEDWEDEL